MDSPNFQPDSSRQANYSSHTRMGALSLLVLVVVICLATLAVLSYTTAHASDVMAQRQAEEVQQRYLDECAAQEFVAQLDATLASNRSLMAAETVFLKLPSYVESAQKAGGGLVQAEARMEGNQVVATFTTGNGRTLTIKLTITDSGGYRIDSWKMSTVENQEPSQGELYIAG